MVSKAIVIILFLLLPLASVASDWRFIYNDERGSSHFYDNEKIAKKYDWKHKVTTVRVWVKTIFSEKEQLEMIREFGPDMKAAFMMALWEVDCSKNTITVLEKTFYKKDGTLHPVSKMKHLEGNEIIHIAPDTIGEYIYTRVCK